MESKMSSHFIRLYKVFFYGSYKLIRFRFMSCLLQDNAVCALRIMYRSQDYVLAW